MRTRLHSFLPACLSLFLLGVGVPAAAEVQPSSDVLLPYFEVDLRGIPEVSRTTLFAICNDGDEPVDVQITVYTNWGIPVLDVPITLQGDEVRTVNLADWLLSGQLPHWTLSAEELAHLQAALAGRASPRDGQFYASETTPELAVGAIGFRSGQTQDVLWGDYFVIDPEIGYSQGETLVSLDRTTECVPECNRHGVRYLLEEGAFDAGTELMFWTRRVATPAPAGELADRFRVRVEADVYDEAGIVIDHLELSLLPIHRLTLADLGLHESFGWLDIETSTESFITAHYSAGDRYSAALHAWCLPPEGQTEGPGVRIEKLTNGTAADVPPGPAIAVGDRVVWTYAVTNSGDVALSDILVEDSDGVFVSCPQSALEPGESMTCEASGVAEACQHSNTATVWASGPAGEPASASDTSHYYGEQQGALSLRAMVQGADANTPPGPELVRGSTASWTYEVTNTGSTQLVGVVVTDQHGGAVICAKVVLDPGETMTCIASAAVVEGQQSLVATASGAPACGPDASASDPTHYYVPPPEPPAIAVEKHTNGEDADMPPGPAVLVGSLVTWTYQVTNVGGFALTGVTVVDDRGVAVTCPKTVLVPGESMTCSGSGTAFGGLYHNEGTATGTATDGRSVTASDPSHYTGVRPRLQIEKLVDGHQADDAASAPRFLAGDPVLWTYVVTNAGDVPLSGIAVTDDRGAVVTCPKAALEPGEAMTCTASGTVVSGLFCNLGTASGDAAIGPAVTAADPACYLGVAPKLALEKLVNGQDADQEPGLTVLRGSTLSWNYVITNVGDTVLSAIVVTDDKGVAVTCPSDVLEPGESMTCTASGVATQGQYCNLGTAAASAGVGAPIVASDPACHYGVWPAIGIEKLTNGQDADTPPGPTIPIGDPVLWTYVVTNTGDVSLSMIVVTDSQGAAVQCPKTTLAAAESMTCVATGTATAGQYANIGTATGSPAGFSAVTASDPGHYYGVVLGTQGCTPGYWKNHTDSWPPTGYSPTQSVQSAFAESVRYPNLSAATLLAALGFDGGSGVEGAAEILLRASVAALLNAAHPDVAYPRTPAQVVSGVNTALASGSRDTMLALAAALDADNNLGCPLN